MIRSLSLSLSLALVELIQQKYASSALNKPSNSRSVNRLERLIVVAQQQAIEILQQPSEAGGTKRLGVSQAQQAFVASVSGMQRQCVATQVALLTDTLWLSSADVFGISVLSRAVLRCHST
jgi:hypothetical protein